MRVRGGIGSGDFSSLFMVGACWSRLEVLELRWYSILFQHILFICTVQSLYYMRVYHRCFLAPTSVCVGGLEVAVQCTNKGMCALVACQCLNTDVKRAPYQLQQARCKSLPRAEIPRKRHQLEFDRA